MKKATTKEWTLSKWHAPAPVDGLATEPDHRVALLARQENIEIMILGNAGMKHKVIAGFTGLPVSTIKCRLNAMGIKISTYREGQGPVARLVFTKLTAAIAAKSIQQIRERNDG